MILDSNTIDTVMFTENPFYFSRTVHILVTNARGSQRLHVYSVVILNSNILDTVIVIQIQLYFSRTVHIVVTNALGSQRVHVLL